MGVDRDRILTIRDMHDVPGRPPMTVPDFVRTIQRRRGGGFRLPALDEFAGPPAIAVIEVFDYLRPGNYRTRWGAHCWLDYDGVPCSGFEDVDPDDPRFYCLSCYNEAIGGAWRRLEVPGPDEREKIERVLLARPNVQQRAFIPAGAVAMLRETDLLTAAFLGTDGDTLEELLAQNVILDVPRPEGV